MCLENNNHSVFKMKYCLYLTTNKLSFVITSEVSEKLKEIFENIAPRYNISINKWVYKEYGIKILFNGHPNTELTKFINAYKSAASRLIKKDFPQIVDNLYKGQFWSKTFCLVTLESGIEEEEIVAYMEKKS